VFARGDIRRLAFILLLCLGAAAVGERLSASEASLTVRFAQPAPADTLRGLVHLQGWAVDHRATPALAPDSVAVFVDRAVPELLGRPLLLGERGRPGRAAFELGWETCTFPPGPYTLRVVVRTPDGLEAEDTRAVAVGGCPGGPLAVLREDALLAPSRAWREGTTGYLAADYQGSAYRLVRRAGGEEPCGVWDGAHVIYADFLLSVDIELPHGAPGEAALVAVRASPRTLRGGAPEGLEGYVARLEPAAGTVSLWRYTADAPPRLLTQARLGPADPFYQLEVLAVADLLALRVNGRTALVARDDGPRWGRLLLGVGATAETTVLYRDLVIRRPPGPASPAGGDTVALLSRS
jgi:hypothetical protein